MIAAALLAGSLAAAPLPGGAMIDENLPNALTSAKVGEWVTYRFDGGDGRVYFWRIAVVGEQTDAKGRPALWVELDVGEHPAMKAPLAQMKVLAARSSGLSADGVTRLLASFGADRPREVEPTQLPQFLGREKPAAPAKSEKSPVVAVTTRRGAPTRLLTLGGTVTASPVEVRVRDTVMKRFWLCDQIPILKLAKVEFPAVAHSMEARDWGLDAKSEMAPPEPGAATIRMEGYNGPELR